MIDHWLLLQIVKHYIICLFWFFVKATSSPPMFSWCAYAWDEERSWNRKNYLKAADEKKRFFVSTHVKAVESSFENAKGQIWHFVATCHILRVQLKVTSTPQWWCLSMYIFILIHIGALQCTAQFWNWEALMMWLAFCHHIIIPLALNIGIFTYVYGNKMSL